MTTYYVRQKHGDNDNSGKSWADAWASLGLAVAEAEAGDTIHVYRGEYDPVVIHDPLRLYGHGAVIDGDRNPQADHGILIFSNWTTVDGFEVRDVNGGGIASRGHHITLTNNYVHHNDGHGISLIKGDYYTVADNEVAYNVGVKGKFATSGISVFNPKEYKYGVDVDYRIKIVRNDIHHNGFDGRTDGYGILFDKWTDYNTTPYFHNALIQGNELYLNGNSGVYLYQADNVLMRWNWMFHNAQDERKGRAAEFGMQNAQGITVIGNIAEAESDKFVFCTGGVIPNHADFTNNRLFISDHPGQIEVSETFKHWNHDTPSPENNYIGGHGPQWWDSYWDMAA